MSLALGFEGTLNLMGAGLETFLKQNKYMFSPESLFAKLVTGSLKYQV